uniref:Heme-binding protein 2 isoform X2 n=1 Tax=Castor canadensis TaxID=51338 RepID=A0A8B7VUN7_CASCN|nr:heme-binding protein 2 isoform X2 [Castor canadensis]
MADVPEPDLGAAEAAAPAVETPAWKAPEDAGPKPGSYEVRHYGPAKWVSTCVESMDWDWAIQTGFTKLNDYLQGNNEKEMKIKMTAPVTSYVEPGPGPFSESTITISLYIPSEQQSDPPRPSESGVFIEDRAEMTVFVRYLCIQRCPRFLQCECKPSKTTLQFRPNSADAPSSDLIIITAPLPPPSTLILSLLKPVSGNIGVFHWTTNV